MRGDAESTKTLLLDLDPSGQLGDVLRSLLHSCKNPIIQVRQKTFSPLEALPPREIFASVADFAADVIFLVLPPKELERVRMLIQSEEGKKCPTPIIAVFSDVQPEETIELMKLGVEDFLTPPLRAADVFPRVWRALKRKSSEELLLHSLKERMGLQQVIGKSPIFLSEIKKIPLIAKCDASVLITGETGTGKEVCARAIHYLSNRAGSPFVPVSCGAIPTELIENELFGHERGAFTGATSHRTGLVEEAAGGTLFLDDVDCLPLMAQVKILRLLQEKEYKPLGSAKYRHGDIRVIAATNIDLDRAVKEMKFRQDLFYRLNIIPLTLPPLRERQEDIPLLADHFLDKHARQFGKRAKDLTLEAVQKLLIHDWPGNVRELENIIERAVVFSGGTSIRQEEILISPPEPEGQESFKKAKARAVALFERRYIERLLRTSQGNISQAARAAEKNRRAFWELIRKHRIDIQTFRLG